MVTNSGSGCFKDRGAQLAFLWLLAASLVSVCLAGEVTMISATNGTIEYTPALSYESAGGERGWEVMTSEAGQNITYTSDCNARATVVFQGSSFHLSLSASHLADVCLELNGNVVRCSAAHGNLTGLDPSVNSTVVITKHCPNQTASTLQLGIREITIRTGTTIGSVLSTQGNTNSHQSVLHFQKRGRNATDTAGIVAGVVIALFVIVVAGYLIFRRRRSPRRAGALHVDPLFIRRFSTGTFEKDRDMRERDDSWSIRRSIPRMISFTRLYNARDSLPHFVAPPSENPPSTIDTASFDESSFRGRFRTPTKQPQQRLEPIVSRSESPTPAPVRFPAPILDHYPEIANKLAAEEPKVGLPPPPRRKPRKRTFVIANQSSNPSLKSGISSRSIAAESKLHPMPDLTWRKSTDPAKSDTLSDANANSGEGAAAGVVLSETDLAESQREFKLMMKAERKAQRKARKEAKEAAKRREKELVIGGAKPRLKGTTRIFFTTNPSSISGSSTSSRSLRRYGRRRHRDPSPTIRELPPIPAHALPNPTTPPSLMAQANTDKALPEISSHTPTPIADAFLRRPQPVQQSVIADPEVTPKKRSKRQSRTVFFAADTISVPSPLRSEFRHEDLSRSSTPETPKPRLDKGKGRAF